MERLFVSLALLDPEALEHVLRNPFGDRDENRLLSDPFGLALDAELLTLSIGLEQA